MIVKNSLPAIKKPQFMMFLMIDGRFLSNVTDERYLRKEESISKLLLFAAVLPRGSPSSRYIYQAKVRLLCKELA